MDNPLCGLCGQPYMVKNPHPAAGKPESLSVVGATYVCIPCAIHTRHIWCSRALEAEAEIRELRKGIKPGGG